MVYINKGEHDNPHEFPKQTHLEGSTDNDQMMYSHTTPNSHEKDSFDKPPYVYRHFQEKEKTYPLDQQADIQDNDSTLYPYINNDIEYGIFKDIISSYHLDCEIKDDFHCNPNCYSQDQSNNQNQNLTSCTHAYDHISQHIHDLESTVQQQQLHDMEEDASIFTTDIGTSCNFNIYKPLQNTTPDSKQTPKVQLQNSFHIHTKHKYRDIFGDSNINYHDFNTGDALSFRDKYTALLQQELQNPYWCLHDPMTTKTYLILQNMDIETMPHTMYFSGDFKTVTKINQVPYQTIDYDDKGMFPAQLMDETPSIYRQWSNTIHTTTPYI